MNVPMINNDTERYLRTARIVIAFWLLGWFLKVGFYPKYLFHEIIAYPVVLDFFPKCLRSPLSVQFFYILPLLALSVFFRPRLFYFFFSSLCMIVSSVVLLLHQDTHNDATFVTSFWVALWLLWFVRRISVKDAMLDVHARSLALCVVGIIFLGGFIGKSTSEYWNGDVLSAIFLQQNFGFTGEWIRAHMSTESIQFCFKWISKMIIIGEAFLIFAPFLPYRLVCVIAIPFMLGISLYTTGMIFSVLFCLIGLLIAGWGLREE